MPEKFVIDFKNVDKESVALVGGKGANLGEMAKAGLPVPPGFIVTAPAYFEVIDQNNLKDKIKAILSDVDVDNPKSLNSASVRVKQLILTAKIPDDLALTIIKAYLKLGRGIKHTLGAVRSSATAEDLPDASFAGQQETFLNVSGEANVVQKVRACWASLFEPRAIFYREQKGFDHFSVGIAVPVQTMIQAQVSGIMFTVNPVTNDKNQVVIEAIWGLGEKIVQGAYTPDHYLIQKQTWKILQKQVNPQKRQLVLSRGQNREVKVKVNLQKQAKLTDDQIVKLAKLGHQIQRHYFLPQDIEWAISGGKIYIVQSRAVTTFKPPDKNKKKLPPGDLKLILTGDPASPGLATGYVKKLKNAKQIDRLSQGEILVSDMTTPDFVPAMKKAAAIVTNQGGQTSHAAIVSRELGIPCVVGTATATKTLKTGTVVTVDGTSGKIFAGGKISKTKTLAPPKTAPVMAKNQSASGRKKAYQKLFAADLTQTATKIYVNLAEPDLAESVAQKNVDGVGLLRAEFMIAQGGVHPKKLIQDQKQEQFIVNLVEGLKKFTQAFYPRPVVYRATDFKTNEYAHLTGGQAFEPEEENPMLGYRGAFRYLADEAVFDLELEAIKRVRNKLGLTNLWLMIPFVRSVAELTRVKRLIVSQNLIRSPSFKLWMMVEIPLNVILLEDFIKVGLDGVSIGTNDLTMLMLGVDRDNAEVASLYDETNPAVLWALKKTIVTCQKHHLTSSVCGQAPSTYPDLTEKLVSWGVTSVSVSPDAIETTRQIIYQAESRAVR